MYFVARSYGEFFKQPKEIIDPMFVKLKYAQDFFLRGVIDGKAFHQPSYDRGGLLFATKGEAEYHESLGKVIEQMKRDLAGLIRGRHEYTQAHSAADNIPHFKSDRPNRASRTQAYKDWASKTNSQETLTLMPAEEITP